MQQTGTTKRVARTTLQTLLIEPDPRERQRLELALSVRGQSVTSQEDHRLALAAFQDAVFPLIILGGGLLDERAGEVCRRVRSTPGGDRTVIVAVVHVADDDIRQAALQSGVDEVVVWPPTGEIVAEQMNQLESLVQSRAEQRQPEPKDDGERFLTISPTGAIRSAAPAAEQLIGFPPAALHGVNAFSFFHPDDAPQLLSLISEAYAQAGGSRAAEVRIRRDGDDWRTVTLSAVNRLNDMTDGGIELLLRGPDATVNVTDLVTRATMHDRVTGLPNRVLFLDRVEHAIARSARSGDPVVVMSVDLNGFQPSGEPLLSDPDDSLIVAAAQRLRSCLRSSDTTSRLDFDQFGILLEDIASTDAVGIVANRIIRAMTLPFVTATGEIILIPHLGTSVSTTSEKRAAQVLRDAGIARTWACVQGSGSHMLFDPSMTPPDDEPITSEFAPLASLLPTPALDERLDDISERLALLEQSLARLGRDA